MRSGHRERRACDAGRKALIAKTQRSGFLYPPILLTYSDLLVSLRFKTKELGVGYRSQRHGIGRCVAVPVMHNVRSNRPPVEKVRCGLQIELRKGLGPT